MGEVFQVFWTYNAGMVKQESGLEPSSLHTNVPRLHQEGHAAAALRVAFRFHGSDHEFPGLSVCGHPQQSLVQHHWGHNLHPQGQGLP